MQKSDSGCSDKNRLEMCINTVSLLGSTRIKLYIHRYHKIPSKLRSKIFVVVLSWH